MTKRLLSAALATGMLAAPSMTAAAQYYDKHGNYYSSQHDYYKHKQHMRTAKRVGIPAAGGAVAGGIIGGGSGALLGGGIGAGAGYLYNRHMKHHGH